MEPIGVDTKINAILKSHPDALEAIISISPKFTRLRNPVMRKIMASRTSVAAACKVAGCTPDDFFEKLSSLGLAINATGTAEGRPKPPPIPGFMCELKEGSVVTLDVRPVIESGEDPFRLIMEKTRELKAGSVLKLINSFEPAPLITILKKQGFEHFVEYKEDGAVHTYFHKGESTREVQNPDWDRSADWQEVLSQYEDQLVTLDVRGLAMPGPMMSILDSLEKLPEGKALLVHHKRIPVYLLPELKDRKFAYRIKETGEGEVHLLIFKEG